MISTTLLAPLSQIDEHLKTDTWSTCNNRQTTPSHLSSLQRVAYQTRWVSNSMYLAAVHLTEARQAAPVSMGQHPYDCMYTVYVSDLHNHVLDTSFIVYRDRDAPYHLASFIVACSNGCILCRIFYLLIRTCFRRTPWKGTG